MSISLVCQHRSLNTDGMILPSKSILPREESATIFALVALLLQMHRLMVPLQIGLPPKSLHAIRQGANKGVDSVRIMCFHVSSIVIAPVEQLATTVHGTLIVAILACRHYPGTLFLVWGCARASIICAAGSQQYTLCPRVIA